MTASQSAMTATIRPNCKHCGRRISESVNGWYHCDTEAARCRDDASFTFAEPKTAR